MVAYKVLVDADRAYKRKPLLTNDKHTIIICLLYIV